MYIHLFNVYTFVHNHLHGKVLTNFACESQYFMQTKIILFGVTLNELKKPSAKYVESYKVPHCNVASLAWVLFRWFLFERRKLFMLISSMYIFIIVGVILVSRGIFF